MLSGIHASPNDHFRFTSAASRSLLGERFDDVWATGVGHRARLFEERGR